MQQIRNTWLKEIGAIKLSCFNGKSTIIQDQRMGSNDKRLLGKSHREMKRPKIISLIGGQRKASTFALGELPASEKEFTF
jgi:hypothetical protein